MKPKQGQMFVNILLKGLHHKWHMIMMDDFITNIKLLHIKLESKCKKCYTYNMQHYDMFAQKKNY